jgi:hypothetical protein
MYVLVEVGMMGRRGRFFYYCDALKIKVVLQLLGSLMIMAGYEAKFYYVV